MESIKIIEAIDHLKTILVEEDCQDSLNKWKRLVINLDTPNGFDFEKFKREINVEEVVTRMLKRKLRI